MPLSLLLLAVLVAPSSEQPLGNRRIPSPFIADTTGAIEVVVVDSLDNLLSQVDLVLETDSGATRWIGRTNRRGRYLFERLPGDRTYTLRARQLGLVPETKTVTLSGTRTITVKLTMARPAHRLADVTARQKTGGLTGRVVPFAAAEFHWAVIEITDSLGLFALKTTVGRKGGFNLRGIPAGGPYVMTVRSIGFEPQVIDDIQIIPDSVQEIELLLFWTGNLAVFPVSEEYQQVDISCGPRPETYINGVRMGRNTLVAPMIFSELKPEDIIERREFGCDPSIPKELRNTIWITAKINWAEILEERSRKWERQRVMYFLGYGAVLTMVGTVLLF